MMAKINNDFLLIYSIRFQYADIFNCFLTLGDCWQSLIAVRQNSCIGLLYKPITQHLVENLKLC